MLEELQTWIAGHQALLTYLGFASLAIFLGSLLVIPWLVAQIPADYFSHEHREPARWKTLHPVFRYTILILKNAVGLILLTAGVAMLVLPGQGLLSIFLGLLLMDYPGKFGLERRIISRPKLLQLVNWLRARQHKPPLKITH